MSSPKTSNMSKSSGLADTRREAVEGAKLNRRQTLQFLGCLSVTGGMSVAGCEANRQSNAEPSPPAAPRVLSEAEFALLSRLTELIIPKTDTAGAIEAKVPEYIEAEIAVNPQYYVGDDLRVLFADGLRWIDAASQAKFKRDFLQLNESEQYRLLEPLCAAADAGELRGRSVQFMRTLKNMTVDGYYTSQVGLMDELRYQGNTPQAEFANCAVQPHHAKPSEF